MDIIGVGLGVVFEEFDEAICKEYDVRRLKTHCKLILFRIFTYMYLCLKISCYHINYLRPKGN